MSSTIARTEVMLEECAGSRAVLQIIPLLHLQQTTHVTPAQVNTCTAPVVKETYDLEYNIKRKYNVNKIIN